MKQFTHNQLTYNQCVAIAYFQLLKRAKEMLSTIEQEELRSTLERADKTLPQIGTVVHELLNPLIYMRLELHPGGLMAIHFGIEPINQLGQLTDITSNFLRLLYKLTSKDVYPIDIENCVRTDWFINSCSGLYEYLEESEHYAFKQLKYKVTAKKRKQLLSVA